MRGFSPKPRLKPRGCFHLLGFCAPFAAAQRKSGNSPGSGSAGAGGAALPRGPPRSVPPWPLSLPPLPPPRVGGRRRGCGRTGAGWNRARIEGREGREPRHWQGPTVTCTREGTSAKGVSTDRGHVLSPEPGLGSVWDPPRWECPIPSRAAPCPATGMEPGSSSTAPGTALPEDRLCPEGASLAGVCATP